MSETLKPCPMCGASARWERREGQHPLEGHYLCCTGEDCFGMQRTAEEVERKWNRRAMPPEVRELLEYVTSLNQYPDQDIRQEELSAAVKKYYGEEK